MTFAGHWRTLTLTLLVASSAGPGPARAALAPEARPVVERYVAAVGGAEVVRSERATRLRGTIDAFGLSGTFEQWTERPDRSATATTIGPFTLREGNDGVTAWRIDQNGKFARQDGKDLEDARASAWFANEMWLAPDQGGGTVAGAGTQRDSSGEYAVLEITPPAGRSRQFWFSTRTGLLDREVAKSDIRTVISTNADWRASDGRLRPHRTRVEVQGLPMNTATVSIDSVWRNPALDPALFTPQAGTVADWRFRGTAGPLRVPFGYGSRHVWVRVAVNTHPAEDFLLDTGASITVIDSGYAARHGIAAAGRLQAAGAGAAGGAALGQLDSLRLEGADGAGLTVGGQKIAILSLNPFLEPFFWRPIAGILGYDFISRFVLTVDYDQGILVLHEPHGFRYAGGGEAIPMTMAGNIPVVQATLDDQYGGAFRLDVGSGSTVDVHGPFVKRHGLRASAGTSYDVIGGGFGGTFTSTVCRRRAMQIGSFRWEEPVVILSGAETGGLASEDYAGNIGNHLLERFLCTFDYERRTVHLEPGRRFGDRDRFSQVGAIFGRIDGRVRAMQVLEGSPAARGGLRLNDEVLAIDGQPIQSFDAEAVRRRFEEGRPGTTCALQVQRAGRRRTIRIRLREML